MGRLSTFSYPLVNGMNVLTFSYGPLSDDDVGDISFFNWMIRFRTVDLQLYLESKKIHQTKVRISEFQARRLHLPVDEGGLYKLRGFIDIEGVVKFYLDYEALLYTNIKNIPDKALLG
jgi:hypothetical protein